MKKNVNDFTRIRGETVEEFFSTDNSFTPTSSE